MSAAFLRMSLIFLAFSSAALRAAFCASVSLGVVVVALLGDDERELPPRLRLPRLLLLLSVFFSWH